MSVMTSARASTVSYMLDEIIMSEITWSASLLAIIVKYYWDAAQLPQQWSWTFQIRVVYCYVLRTLIRNLSCLFRFKSHNEKFSGLDWVKFSDCWWQEIILRKRLVTFNITILALVRKVRFRDDRRIITVMVAPYAEAEAQEEPGEGMILQILNWREWRCLCP